MVCFVQVPEEEPYEIWTKNNIEKTNTYWATLGMSYPASIFSFPAATALATISFSSPAGTVSRPNSSCTA